MIPPDAQRAMSKRAASKVAEVKGSHAVYVSQPRAVASPLSKQRMVQFRQGSKLATPRDKFRWCLSTRQMDEAPKNQNLAPFKTTRLDFAGA
jgi:hypothetical protein